MKKLILPLFLAFSINMHGADHTIQAVGLSYSPANLEVQIGDNVTIQASTIHPTTQVSESTWNANGITPVAGGWGTETTEFTFTINSFATIYYVCDAHIDSGMKGVITVSAATGVAEYINKIGFEVVNNPVSTTMYYKVGSQVPVAGISFYDMGGRELQNEWITASQGNILLELPAGQYLYVVRGREEELLATGRIVVSP
jgi:plastocyanin